MSRFQGWARTFKTGEAIEKYRFVKLDSTQDQVIYADAGEEPVGVSDEAKGSGKNLTVDLMSKPGTLEVTLAGSVSYGDAIYVAADGKASGTVSGRKRGLALESGSAGQTIEILPNVDVSPAAGGSDEVFDIFDDFAYWVDGDLWTETSDAGATGAVGVTDAKNGVISVFCDGDDNDGANLHSTNELAVIEASKRIVYKTRVKLAEANTDDANIVLGLSDLVTVDLMVDNGAGPAASYNGVVIYKVDGGTVWQAEASNAGTQTNIDLTGGADDFDDDTWVDFLIEIIPGASTTADVNIYKDGVLLGSITGWTFPSAEMHIVQGVKAGGANEEELKIDYVRFSQQR